VLESASSAFDSSAMQIQYRSFYLIQLSSVVCATVLLTFLVMLILLATRLHLDFNCGSFQQLACTGVDAITYWSVQLLADLLPFATTFLLSISTVLISASLSDFKDLLASVSQTILLFLPCMLVSLLFLYIISILLRNSGTLLLCVLILLLFFVVTLHKFCLHLVTR
jgi:hypothetical protein